MLKRFTRKRKDVFFKGEKDLLIKTVNETVINNQISVSQIIDIIKTSGVAQNNGFNVSMRFSELLRYSQLLQIGEWIFHVNRPDTLSLSEEIIVDCRLMSGQRFAVKFHKDILHPVFGLIETDSLTDREIALIAVGSDYSARLLKGGNNG